MGAGASKGPEQKSTTSPSSDPKSQKYTKGSSGSPLNTSSSSAGGRIDSDNSTGGKFQADEGIPRPIQRKKSSKEPSSLRGGEFVREEPVVKTTNVSPNHSGRNAFQLNVINEPEKHHHLTTPILLEGDEESAFRPTEMVGARRLSVRSNRRLSNTDTTVVDSIGSGSQIHSSVDDSRKAPGNTFDKEKFRKANSKGSNGILATPNMVVPGSQPSSQKPPLISSTPLSSSQPLPTNNIVTLNLDSNDEELMDAILSNRV